MKKHISYRSAEPQDLSVLLRIDSACFPEVDRFSRRSIYRFLRRPAGSVWLELILADEVAVGYALYLARKNSARLRYYTLCILPEYSGMGIAQEYLSRRLNRFPDRFCELVMAVRKSNGASIHLHEKFGFQPVHGSSFLYPDGEQGILMTKVLSTFRRKEQEVCMRGNL
jgi:ribosomal protein S18 acetylase RimI-like enzyme